MNRDFKSPPGEVDFTEVYYDVIEALGDNPREWLDNRIAYLLEAKHEQTRMLEALEAMHDLGTILPGEYRRNRTTIEATHREISSELAVRRVALNHLVDRETGAKRHERQARELKAKQEREEAVQRVARQMGDLSGLTDTEIDRKALGKAEELSLILAESFRLGRQLEVFNRELAKRGRPQFSARKMGDRTRERAS